MYEEHYDEDGFKLCFDDAVSKVDKRFFMRTFPNVSRIAERKVHCTSCQTHIGTAPIAEAIIRKHPVLGVTQCSDCHDFYNSGEFSKGEDGSELYCRWCGQGGEVYCCSNCPFVFCKSCIIKNLSRVCVQDIASNDNWSCFRCSPNILSHLRAQHWALVNFIQKQKKEIKKKNYTAHTIMAMMKEDKTTCCSLKGRKSLGGSAKTAFKQRTSSIPEESDSGKDSPKPSTSKAAAGSLKDKEESMPLAALVKPKEYRSVKVVPAHLLLSQPQVILNSVLARKEKPSSEPKSKSTAERKKQQAINQLDRIVGGKRTKEVHRAAKRQLESQKESKADDQPEERPPAKKAKDNNDEVVCTPDIIATANNVAQTARPPLLNTLRDMVNGPHPNSPLGKGQKEFEAKLLVGAETCHQIMGKIATLAGSQSVKQIRHLRDLKELYLHMSYLLTYGVRRLQGLQEQCIEDVRALGFDNASEFLLTDVATNVSAPEESDKGGQAEGTADDDDENDCEIIEQRATVIEVDSDEDEGSQPAQSNQVAARFEV
uniref:PHD-type domain-containing protein n=1 Tax=Anopheles albimanus TaxID=7167 RepID=A0A182FVT4_ANOAL